MTILTKNENIITHPKCVLKNGQKATPGSPCKKSVGSKSNLPPKDTFSISPEGLSKIEKLLASSKENPTDFNAQMQGNFLKSMASTNKKLQTKGLQTKLANKAMLEGLSHKTLKSTFNSNNSIDDIHSHLQAHDGVFDFNNIETATLLPALSKAPAMPQSTLGKKIFDLLVSIGIKSS